MIELRNMRKECWKWINPKLKIMSPEKPMKEDIEMRHPDSRGIILSWTIYATSPGKSIYGNAKLIKLRIYNWNYKRNTYISEMRN